MKIPRKLAVVGSLLFLIVMYVQQQSQENANDPHETQETNVKHGVDLLDEPETIKASEIQPVATTTVGFDKPDDKSNSPTIPEKIAEKASDVRDVAPDKPDKPNDKPDNKPEPPQEVTTVPNADDDMPGLYALPRLGESECCNFKTFKVRCDDVMKNSCREHDRYNLFSHGWGVDLMVNTGNKVGVYVYTGGRPFYMATVGAGWHYARGVCPREKQNLDCYFKKVAPTKLPPKRAKGSCNDTAVVPEHCCDGPMLHQLGYQYLTQPLPKYKQMAAKRAEELRMPPGAACATLHVRRSDSLLNFGWGGTGKAVYRNVSITEYLEIAQPYLEKRGIKNILLMTDDQDAIYETTSNSQYTWHYLNRTRFSGVQGGWENHFPSGSRESEVVDVLALLLGTAQCSIVIGSGSRFSYMHYSNSKFYHKDPWMVYVNTLTSHRPGESYHVNYRNVTALFDKYKDTPQYHPPSKEEKEKEKEEEKDTERVKEEEKATERLKEIIKEKIKEKTNEDEKITHEAKKV